MSDLGSLTIWVAILAIASAVQTLMLIAVAVMALSFYRNVTRRIEQIEREQIGPLVTRAHAAIDQVHEVTARVKQVDEDVRHMLARTGARARSAASKVQSGLWPVIGLSRGFWATVASFVSGVRDIRDEGASNAPAGRETRARLAYQGGTQHVRS